VTEAETVAVVSGDDRCHRWSDRVAQPHWLSVWQHQRGTVGLQRTRPLTQRRLSCSDSVHQNWSQVSSVRSFHV